MIVVLGISWTTLGGPNFAGATLVTLTVTPTVTEQGKPVQVSGTGYTGNGAVNLWLQQGTGNANVVAAPQADTTGAWSITLPPFQIMTAYTVWAIDGATATQSSKITFNIVAIGSLPTTITTQSTTSSSSNSISTSSSSATTSSVSTTLQTTVVTVTSSTSSTSVDPVASTTATSSYASTATVTLTQTSNLGVIRSGFNTGSFIIMGLGGIVMLLGVGDVAVSGKKKVS